MLVYLVVVDIGGDDLFDDIDYQGLVKQVGWQILDVYGVYGRILDNGLMLIMEMIV